MTAFRKNGSMSFSSRRGAVDNGFVRGRFLLLTLLSLVLLTVSGCSPQLLLNNGVPLQREVAPLPDDTNCRIAVLPFLNDSEFTHGGIILQKVFAAQLLLSGQYQLSTEGDIVKAYQQLRLFPEDQPTLEQLRIIADRVGAPLLLTGIVLEMEEGRGEHQTVIPQLAMEVELRDPASGEILWTTFHRRSGSDYKKTMHFGTLHTMTGLSRQMAEEIINLWHEKGFPKCED